MLELKQIKKNYITSSETVSALKGVDIAFRDKEFVSILGPSGCGKTTLLNIIGGLDKYTSGDLVINGRSTKSYKDRDWDVYRNHRVGFIFQSYNLIPHQTILGNVELALTISGISKEERVARAKRALDRVGLEGQYSKRPNQLSGGQCQRVAIARALVNDPEILLADEPTGALDTVTSVQIMNLIREIAGERLVIMVTHNPELAQEYSTRIVRLLDGLVIEDSNPVTEEELAEAEALEIKRKDEEAEAAAYLAAATAKEKRAKKKKKEKAKMSFFTAFRLSARNLVSKKGRTTMVGIAGSIGIIGIALVLAFRAGILGYVDNMQNDMLSGNPIMITEKTYDFSALMGMMTEKVEEDGQKYKIPDKVYIASLVEYIAEIGDAAKGAAIKNNISPEYIEYLNNMDKSWYEALTYEYGIDINANLYTNFKTNADDAGRGTSISALTSMYTAMLTETKYKDYASLVGMIAPSFGQLPNNENYILNQYNLVGDVSRFAKEANEIMLVLNSEDEISDLLLARFGFYRQDEFLEIINKLPDTDDEGNVINPNPDYNKELYREYFSYDELLGKTLVYYPNDTVFKVNETASLLTGSKVDYYPYSDNFNTNDGFELKVVGILTPKESVNFGTLQSGIYYTEDFVQHTFEVNRGSQIFDYISSIDETNTSQTAALNYYIPYTFTYVYDGVTKLSGSSIGPASSAEDMMSSMMGSAGAGFDHTEMKTKFLRTFSGVEEINKVSIYPKSFDTKAEINKYLDRWNTENENNKITYTDTLELVIGMIKTMVDVVSYALIAFVSVSLVVSTVMIGIITYVSVVERIKEIGVIRSLGGRKRDVSNLFIAETGILGLLSGLIGIGFTYLISLIVNLIFEPIINYSNIAALPFGQAAVLICLSIGLTLLSGLLPARSAARKDPVVALRTE